MPSLLQASHVGPGPLLCTAVPKSMASNKLSALQTITTTSSYGTHCSTPHIFKAIAIEVSQLLPNFSFKLTRLKTNTTRTMAERDRVPDIPSVVVHNTPTAHQVPQIDYELSHASEIIAGLIRSTEIRNAISRLTREDKIDLAVRITSKDSFLDNNTPYLLAVLDRPLLDELCDEFRDRKPVRICMWKESPIDSAPWLVQVDTRGGPYLVLSMVSMISSLHINFDPMLLAHAPNPIDLFHRSDPYVLPGQGHPDTAFFETILSLMPSMRCLQQLNLELNVAVRQYNATQNPSFTVRFPQWLARFSEVVVSANRPKLWIFARVTDYSKGMEMIRDTANCWQMGTIDPKMVETWIYSYRPGILSGTGWGLPWFGTLTSDQLAAMRWPDKFKDLIGDPIFWRQSHPLFVTELNS